MKRKYIFNVIIGFLLPITLVGQQAQDSLEINIGASKKIILIANDLNDFENVKIDSIVSLSKKQLNDGFNNTSTNRITQTFTLDTNNLGINLNQSGKSNFIVTGLIGAGLARNIPITSLGVTMGFEKYESNSDKIKFGLYLNALGYYSFTKNEKDNFLTSITPSLELGININDIRVLGVGVLWNTNSPFEKTTFKLFHSIKIKNTPVYICPELYLEGAFKKVYPGISIRL